jgi:RNA polymerase sigma-70 factor (sigma-E family)
VGAITKNGRYGGLNSSDQAEPRKARAIHFERVIAAESLALLRLGFLLCGDRALAEDLVAEAFTRAWMPWDNGQVQELTPYVRRILVNLNLVAQRRRSLDQLEQSRHGRDDRTFQVDDFVVARVDVVRALSQLPIKQRKVVVLRYYLGLSEGEIAKELGISVGTVKSRSFNAIKALRPLFEGQAK